MSNDAVIEVSQLCKSYRNSWRSSLVVNALQHVNLDVQAGEVFGLLGPNGAGKTTFIKVLLGIVRKSAGKVRLLGAPEGSRKSRRNIGYLPEQLQFSAHHTAYSALDYYGGLSGVSAAQVRSCRDELLQQVGLEKWGRVSIRKFSKGMMQRLGLAQAVLHKPQLLILDEPTDGLDPVWRSQVRNILVDLRNQGHTVFLNSHLLQEVEMVCDRVAILDKGHLKFVGSVDDVKSQMGADVNSQLELELLGSQAAIQSALGETVVSSWDPLANKRFMIRLKLNAQDDVDDCVDRLRASGISIVRLTKAQASLEDAFLSILEESSQEATDSVPAKD